MSDTPPKTDTLAPTVLRIRDEYKIVPREWFYEKLKQFTEEHGKGELVTYVGEHITHSSDGKVINHAPPYPYWLMVDANKTKWQSEWAPDELSPKAVRQWLNKLEDCLPFARLRIDSRRVHEVKEFVLNYRYNIDHDLKMLCAIARTQAPAFVQRLEMIKDAYIDTRAIVGVDHVQEPAGGVEHPAKLQALKTHDREMWQTYGVSGMTQARIAEILNEKYGTDYTQARVSEGIKRAQAHAEASGLDKKAAHLTKRGNPTVSIDPAKLELGERTDGRSKHQVARMNQKSKEK